MRSDSFGMFWTNENDKLAKKHEILQDEGWLQIYPGFWAEKRLIDKGADPNDIIVGMEQAYQLARDSKSKPKAVPPEPTWLSADYLPYLKESLEFDVPLFTDAELIDLSYEWYNTGRKHELVFDIECYVNYFLIAFKSPKLQKVVYFETGEGLGELNIPKLKWLLAKFTIIGFNSNGYDIHIAAMALAGCSTQAMKTATTAIIEYREPGWRVLRGYKVKKLECDHIDIMEVAPLMASLKIYGGRMHSKKMQDLPFPPDATLTDKQIAIVRFYCVNDLQTTEDLLKEIGPDITLREELSGEYGLDLRSKSDAQIAEAVLASEIQKISGTRAHRVEIEPGSVYRYRVPSFIRYSTPLMQGVLQQVANAQYVVNEHGKIGLPPEIKELQIKINNSVYTMGIGGLHSTEKSAIHYDNEHYALIDRDVTSYYPFIILLLGLFPHHLGREFLTAYRKIVEKRLAAKKSGDKRTANSLKIVINGSFGKFGSQYSTLYSPDLLIQTTITGQLSLLMLIERLELAGIQVVSANTDGIVIKPLKRDVERMNGIIEQWEADTGFNTEETRYSALYSRDVNNYVAVTHKDEWEEGQSVRDRVKTKGAFADPGLSKNPQNLICVEAVISYLVDNKPIHETIRSCKDIQKFVTVRTVSGGGVKLHENADNEYLGKAIRWYYSTETETSIVYAKNGNTVPKSVGAKPLMELTNEFPNDVDYDWYERECDKIMRTLGCA
ncbi:DNA polymerase B [Alteromonas phage vB_AcoS-R7M]|uniref:DNA polymerase B n=1 Tax=Alteromonas phage vB_AcoS-R7M TaxID=2729541 RepID=A0A6M3YNE2_9CAUD|nr:DNA polymerase [Alteromonas phage vB_AcoS-R7M]QJI53365.1 DNA polymerase B [Alteromonas phage vB_AcoS-R7M]